MAILHADNFSVYGTTSALLLDGVYAEIQAGASSPTLVTDPDGVSTGYVLKGNGNIRVRYVMPSAQATAGIAVRMYLPVLPTDTTSWVPAMQMRSASNTVLYTLFVNTTGGIQICSGSTLASVIASSTGPVMAAGSWYHIEWKMVVSATVGVHEVRVEGAAVINATSLNTGVTNIQQITIGDIVGFAFRTVYYKDLVVWDGSGSANNNFLGSVLVSTLTPTSDAALNWTPSSGATGYGILDNIPPVDATYLYAGDSPIPSAYKGGLSDLPATVTSVKAIVTKVRAAKSDGGDGSMQVGVISDPAGTPATGLGTDRPITTSQSYWQDVFELDPKTSAAWLPPAVNLAQIQINRTT